MILGIFLPLRKFHGIGHDSWKKALLRKTVLESAELKFFRTIGEYIQSNSSSEDTIFIWGFAPQIYYLANRRPASRFLHCGYYTGATAFDSDLEKGPDATGHRIVPNSQAMLLQDLKENKPQFIIDSTPSGSLGFTLFGINQYPLIYSHLETYYKFSIDVSGVHIYERIEPPSVIQ